MSSELEPRRSRAEDWLGAVHSLHSAVGRSDLDGLLARVMEVLVVDLRFKTAAVLELDPDGRVNFARRAPGELPAGLVVDRQMVSVLAREPSGGMEAAAEGAMARLATQLGMGRVRWASEPTARGTTFLMLVSHGSPALRPDPFPSDDPTHLTMFCSHVVALLNNVLLFAKLQQERRELEATNLELDRSLGRLRETQDELMESTRLVARASREAGMAEVATGILHNVGNVLNSVNVCADVASDQVEQLPVPELDRCIELLREQADLGAFFESDPRAPKVVPFLRSSVDLLARARAELKQELDELRRHLGHVGTIISRQQAYAKASFAEVCDLALLMEDALLLARPGRTERGVRVLREFADVGLVQVDKHRVLQILVNLITNAVQSLESTDLEDKRLTARVRPDGDRVLLEIVDNGMGITAEDAPLIFQHGFTTRREGHGFGLHTSALTAKELGGALTFSSRGPGTGATFTLSLPMKQSRPGAPSRGEAA